MLKFLGIIIICVSVALIGFVLSENLKHRRNYLSLLKQFAGLAVSEMRCNNKNIFSLFSSYGKRELIFLTKLNTNNIYNSERVREVVISGGILEEDAFVVVDFISRLGSSDIEGQIEHCRFFEQKFEQMLCSAKAELNERGRLFKSLFFSLAAALFIILI